MGLFDRFKKQDECIEVQAVPGKLYAPISGTYIKLENIPDPVFSQGIMGPGCGIEPSEGKLYAPVNGKVISVAETKHAVGIESENGAEILIHVGMDTVNMQGRGFELKIEEGSQVKCGQLLMNFDLDAIKEAGYPATTAFVLTNADEFPNMSLSVEREYAKLEEFGAAER